MSDILLSELVSMFFEATSCSEFPQEVIANTNENPRKAHKAFFILPPISAVQSRI